MRVGFFKQYVANFTSVKLSESTLPFRYDSARAPFWKNVPSIAGTQVLDRGWQSLKTFFTCFSVHLHVGSETKS